jgi:diguanylate cyclase (GGDEF)-like protein
MKSLPGTRNPGSYSSSLHDSSWMALVRMVFLGTAINLLVFCILQYHAGNYLFASFELVAVLGLLWCAWRFPQMRNPLLLVNLLLCGVFCFLLYIIAMPGASATAFVWAYMVPILAYLLLGRVGGALLSIPFSILATLLYLHQYHGALDPAGLIDLGNALFCGLLIILFMHIYEGRRAAAHQELQRIARTDALTGVASRGSFEEALVQSIREAERSSQHLVLVILDVDHFKSVNDRWGHDGGDKALQHICNSLGERLRISDTLGRLGGEEFGLILRNTDRAGAEPLVEQLRTQICNNPLHYGKQVIELSATFGLAEWPVDGRTIDDLYRCVDRRLYSGKNLGRNQVVSQEPG